MHALLLTSWLFCQGLDLSTTIVGLNSHQVHEGNAIMRGQHLPEVKVAVNVGVLLAYTLHKSHSTAIPLAMATAGCIGGGLNLHTLAKAREGAK